MIYCLLKTGEIEPLEATDDRMIKIEFERDQPIMIRGWKTSVEYDESGCEYTGWSLRRDEIIEMSENPEHLENLKLKRDHATKHHLYLGPNVDHCACCGEPIPEGTQICPNCEKGNNK